MNKELEIEAEKYAWKKKNPFSKEILANELVLASKTDFIAGATSKYVEKQKLEFAIEQLKKLKESELYDKIKYVESSITDYELMKLEQKLFELENEPTNT